MDRMDRRMEMLKRLMEVSSVVEEMHSAELQRKMALVREAERAIDAQKRSAVGQDCRTLGRGGG